MSFTPYWLLVIVAAAVLHALGHREYQQVGHRAVVPDPVVIVWLSLLGVGYVGYW